METTIIISMVTMNRRDILARTLGAIFDTCQADDIDVLVTNNASTDGTRELLDDLESQGKLKAWHLKENGGTPYGRNAHWANCIGQDAVRMDDKVFPLAPGWLTSLKRLSDLHNAVVAVPYDPTVQYLHSVAPCVPYLRWDSEQGQGGPLIFIPGKVTAALGGVDELHPDIRYGWDDVAYIQRAILLGYEFGFSLRSPVQFVTSASPEARAKAMEFYPVYVERLRQYREAERDVFIDVTQTQGYQMGLEARG